MTRLTISILLIFTSLQLNAFQLDSLIEILDNEIQNKSKYENEKVNRIHSILKFLENPDMPQLERFNYNKILISEYEKYSYDSTVIFLEKNLVLARQIGDKELIDETLLTMGATLSKVGRSTEALDILKVMDSTKLDRQNLISYLNINRKIYENLSYYASLSEYWQLYKDRYNSYKSRLEQLLPEEHGISLEIKEKDLLDNRELEECLKVNTLRLSRTQIGEPNYSLITFQRSLIYGLNGDIVQQKKNLMLSTISDIRGVVKDNASLASLASTVYQEGEIERAYYYIQSSYEDAIKFNSGLRFQEISRTLAPIAKSFQELSNRSKDRLQFNVIVISILSIGLLFTILLLYRQLNKLSIARNNLTRSLEELNRSNLLLQESNQKQKLLYDDLSESNLVKEHYIANFLNIHSDYINKMDSYQKLVKRMLNGRKQEQLLNQINSGELIEAEIKSFYKTFDEAFLSIYPGFISQFNKLLRDEEGVELAEGELFTTELRVFALIRLGVTDSSTIARVLRYSVNTIYNYRVKMKNKAKDRENFEKQVQLINAV